MMNISFKLETNFSDDYFADLYSDPKLQIAFFLNYWIGWIGVVGISFVTWFERSGQAGQFRTLVNQLVSLNLDQVSLF